MNTLAIVYRDTPQRNIKVEAILSVSLSFLDLNIGWNEAYFIRLSFFDPNEGRNIAYFITLPSLYPNMSGETRLNLSVCPSLWDHNIGVVVSLSVLDLNMIVEMQHILSVCLSYLHPT